MAKTYLVDLDGTDIRFTPEGKVSVVDAIEALCASCQPEQVWRNILRDHPDVEALCETYRFADTAAAVVDATGWSVIEDLLPMEALGCI